MEFLVKYMKIKLENIGVIEDSTININGITVITGRNNSGKTTLGKSLFSIFNAIEALYENSTIDISGYILSKLTRNLLDSELNKICRTIHGVFDKEKQQELDSIVLLKSIYSEDYPKFKSLEDLSKYIDNVAYKIMDLSTSDIKHLIERFERSLLFKNLLDNFEDIKEDFIRKCQELKFEIEKYSDLVDYQNYKMILSLTEEFENQIAPVKIQKDLVSHISVFEDEKEFSLDLCEAKHTFHVDGDLTLFDIDNVVFIDDVNVINSICMHFQRNNLRRRSNVVLEEYIYVPGHNHCLQEKLQKLNRNSVSVNNSYSLIEDKINEAFSENIVLDDDSLVCESDKLNLSNLAMGSKIFAIIKMLLNNSSLNEKSLLILDEPEAHLHPNWQNILAEVIVILSNELNVKIVVTSHSSNFVLALQTFSMKYQYSNKVDFYITEKVDDYRVNYKNVNDDLSVIYADFAKQFSSMKALFDYLTRGE